MLAGILSSLLMMLSACVPLLEPPASPCDRARLSEIYWVEPSSGTTVRQIAFFDIAAAWKFEPGDGLSLTTSGARLSLDGKDLTEKASLSLSEDSPPTIGLFLLQVTEPLEEGQHTAQVRLKSYGGRDYCYEWDFFVTLPENPLIIITPSHGTAAREREIIEVNITNTLDEALTGKAIAAIKCTVEQTQPQLPIILQARETRAVEVTLTCSKPRQSWLLQVIAGLAPFVTPAQCNQLRPEIINSVRPPENATIMQAAAFDVEVLWGFEHGDGLAYAALAPAVRLYLDERDVTEKARIGLCADYPSSCGGIIYKVINPLERGKHTARITLKSHKGREYCFEWDFWVELEELAKSQ
jgi:hypothetical protein